MSIEKDYGEFRGDFPAFTPICDLCGDMLPTECDWDTAVDAQKAAGWKNEKIDGEWHSVCCECQRED